MREMSLAARGNGGARGDHACQTAKATVFGPCSGLFSVPLHFLEKGRRRAANCCCCRRCSNVTPAGRMNVQGRQTTDGDATDA